MAYELEKWLPLDKSFEKWSEADFLVLASSRDAPYIMLKYMTPTQIQKLQTIINEIVHEHQDSTDLLYKVFIEYNNKLNKLDHQ